MRRRRYHVTQIDPPIGPYYLMVLWDEPASCRHRLWMWLLRKIGLRDR